MLTEPASRNNRLEIDKRLVAKSDNISKTPETGCLENPSIDEFISLWQDLLEYYQSHDDREINIEVIRDYLRWTRRFSEIAQSEEDEDCRDTAEEAYEDLTYALGEIIKVVGKRLYPQGR